ncbi:MAG: hypothetical protein WCP68_11505 [Enhydrobacter sp.]
MAQRRTRIILTPRDDGELFEPLLVGIEDACAVTGCRPSDIRRMIDRRQIEAVHLDGGRVVIKARSLVNVCGERLLLVRNPKRAHELDGAPFAAREAA